MRAIAWLTMGLFLVAVPALADDIQPPWWRGQVSTTSQVWEFLTPDQLVHPDGPAPGGQPPLPGTMVYVEPVVGPWLPTWGGRQGVWPLSGWMDVWVTNHEPPNEVKIVQVQVTWLPQESGARPVIDEFNPPPSDPLRILAEVPLPTGWMETTYYWEIRPNPPQEQFFIRGSIWVDELVVDTWCIPEPATLSLLALGGLTVVRRKRK